MAEPVELEVLPPAGERKRLTVALRPILAIPHALMVGGPGLGVGVGGARTGVFGLLALLIALFDWVSILATGHPVAGLQGLKANYLQWRARVLVYCAFLRDEYPPFGEGPYPVTLRVAEPPVTRDKVLVGLRLLLVLPHALVLLLLLVAWVLVALYAWVVILVTARHPAWAWRFARDIMGYALRVEAYLLLFHDQFPSFDIFEVPSAEPAPV